VVGTLQCKYDLRGNLIEKTSANQTYSFNYDPLNRLVEATLGNKKVSYAYDPLGRKISKTLFFLMDDQWQEEVHENILYDGKHDIGTLSADGTIKDLRILGNVKHPEIPSTIAIEIADKPYATFLDCQGNIRGLIDISTKVVVATYDYSAFGKQLNTNNNLFNRWQYASKRYDLDLELIDFGKRHYYPLLGRWLSIDPAGFMDSRNLYQFNFNNPFRYTDPNGEFVFLIPFFCGAFGIGAAGTAVVAIEVVAAKVVLTSLVAGAAIWGISEGLTKIHQAVNDRRFNPYYSEESTEVEVKEKKKRQNTINIYAPDRPLPHIEGIRIPDTDVPHTQLGTRNGKRGKYPQAREFGYDGKPIHDIDFTDHGSPHLHPLPHKHRWNENSTGGSPSRGNPEPLTWI